MRRVGLPLTGSEFNIPDDQEYTLLERPSRFGLEHNAVEEKRYTFFPVGHRLADRVHVSTYLKDFTSGVVLQEVADVLPLGDFIILKHGKEPNMPTGRLRTGMRVEFSYQQQDGSRASAIGTLVTPKAADTLKLFALIYTDDEDRLFNCDTPAKQFRIPRNHRMLVPPKHVTPLENQNDYESLKGMAPGVGVTSASGFRCENPYNGETFVVPPQACGRLLYVTNGWATVSWFNWDTRFHRRETMPDGQARWEHCMRVPMAKLEWCTVSAGDGSFRSRWSQVPQGNLKGGDYVMYNHHHPCQINLNVGIRLISKGTILQVVANEGPYVLVKLAGGCALDEIGAKAQVDPATITPLEEPFIPRSATVEIVADLKFKKGNLKGQRALVLLPNDMDGDIGIQFKEDVGGGSLDGIGESGKCLYVPASAVKVSE